MKQLCVVHISMLALAAGLPLGAALAQQPAAPRPVAPRTPAPATTQQVAPQAEGQLPAAQAEPLAPLPPPPPPLWRPDQARALLNYIYGVGREGLNPYDYEPDGLLAALSSGDPAVLAKEATDRFNKLSSDLALGHVRGEARIGWHVVDKDLDEARQRALLVSALNENRIPDVLNGLLPMHPQYASLRSALQATPRSEVKKVNKIRLNMDRWRWLPRDLGQKYIIVNVPAFHATLVENGVTRWKHRAIAGAIKTPTPQLSVMATGVILNPWWEVPPSITKEVAGKPGYVALKGKDGKIQRWRQPPGPNNALGQLKFVMYNPYNIYLHDTNARSRFNATSAGRALSHGCVRTEHVLDLATELLGDDGGEWTPEKIREALGSKNAKQANFVKPVPVHIVYFSVAALNDGTIVNYTDVYKRDDQVIAALLDGSGKAPGTPARKVATN